MRLLFSPPVVRSIPPVFKHARMPRRTNIGSVLGKALPLLLLAGCFGGEPNEKDARAAWVDAPSGGGGTDNFAEFKLAGCKAASGAPGYQCDVAYRLPGGALLNASGRFFKNGEKWVFEPARR